MSDIDFTAVISDLVSEGKSRDGVIISLVTEHGVTLNTATKEWGKYARNNGLSKAIVSFKVEALEWLANEYTADTWNLEAVQHGVSHCQVIYGVKADTARDYCKAFSKQLNVTHPTLDPRKAMFDWLVGNASRTDTATMKADFKLYGKELGRSDSNVNEYWKGFELHLAIMAVRPADDELTVAWATYRAVKRDFEANKRVNRNRIHPDKVSNLGDAELTDAYTKLFQRMNTKQAA